MKKKVGATKGKRQRTRPGVRDLGEKNAAAVTGGLLPAVKSVADGTSTANSDVFVKVDYYWKR